MESKMAIYDNFLILIFNLRGCNLGRISSYVSGRTVASQMLKHGLKKICSKLQTFMRVDVSH